jgi:hypothetical protein
MRVLYIKKYNHKFHFIDVLWTMILLNVVYSIEICVTFDVKYTIFTLLC